MYNYSIDYGAPRSTSKSIFHLDWALIMQVEHEKCLEMNFAQIEPILNQCVSLHFQLQGEHDPRTNERKKLPFQSCVSATENHDFLYSNVANFERSRETVWLNNHSRPKLEPQISQNLTQMSIKGTHEHMGIANFPSPI